jgi:hypothetical protein
MGLQARPTGATRSLSGPVALLPLVAMLVVVTLLAGCSGGDDTGGRPTPSRMPSSSTPTVSGPPPTTVAPVRRTWPLTGLPRHRRLPDHPVYVVKIDNTSGARPQIGLDDADLVVEELDEGGLTRLAAFYYSTIPSLVGPVRSMRISDIGITEPAHAFIVASGAAGKTMKALNEAGIDRVTEGAVGFYRSTTRPAPYNLMMKLTALAAHVDRTWLPPRVPYLPFGGSTLPPGGRTVRSIRATFSGAHTDDWRLRGGSWVRTNSYAEPGHDFRADNVLILRVRVGDAGYLDPAGNPVPETFFFGHGAATLVHGHRAVTGSWHKDGTQGAVRLTDVHGAPIRVPPGHTFVELIPARGGGVLLGR